MKLSSHDILKRRHRRARAKIRGTASRPRLSVSRSSRHIVAQLIDDERAETLAAASDIKISAKKDLTKTKKAELVGREIAQKAKDAGISKVVFDRGGRRYHGRVKALADSARSEGLTL